MKKTGLLVLAAGFSLAMVSSAWSIRLGDIFDQMAKPPPKQEQPAPAEPTPEPAPSTPPATEPPPETPAESQGGGGLLGILEGTGVVDKKTSRIIRGAGQALQALQPIAYEEERAIGGSLALEVFERFGGPYKNEKLQKYITLVGQGLVSVSDRPDIPYHFAVLNTEQPNAFATPGGYVFVSVGLLKLLRNEAELAGVLAHEIAHITHRHALQTLERSKTLKGLTSLTTAVLDKDPAMFDQIIDQVSNVLFTHGLDKNLEYEADAMGMEYAYRMGYHPQGLMEFLKVLHRHKGESSIFFSTHPSPRDRYNKMALKLKEYKDLQHTRVLKTRFISWTKGQL